MRYTAEMAHAAARKGAAWLDKRCPNWINEIDLEILNLRSPDVCVLGQTAECLLPGKEPDYSDRLNYSDVVAAYAPRRQQAWATALGFNIPIDVRSTTDYIYSDVGIAYEMLTIAWRELIRERLKA